MLKWQLGRLLRGRTEGRRDGGTEGGGGAENFRNGVREGGGNWTEKRDDTDSDWGQDTREGHSDTAACTARASRSLLWTRILGLRQRPPAHWHATALPAA
jgi:hypothetical protein